MQLPEPARLFGNRRPVAPRAFHAAYGRGKPGREVKRPLNSLRTILTALGGIEIAHQNEVRNESPAPMVSFMSVTGLASWR